MIKELGSLISQNKNLLMLISAGIYISALYSVFSGHIILFTLLITIIFLLFGLKNILPLKIIIVWTLVFYIGILNTTLRIKGTDPLLNIAPVNSEIAGKIVSVPQNKDGNKISFFFDVNQITYDDITRNFNNEKVLVTLNSDEKFRIYDSYKIRGRLSLPFKAGNPSQFDYGNYLRNYNAYAVFYGRNPYSMKDLDIPCYEKIYSQNSIGEKFLQKINDYRENILKIHSSYLSSPNLEILGGIVFGDDAVSPPKEIKQSFVNSGLLHILAASGMNVAFIFSFFFFFLNLFRINYKVNVLICMGMVITYVLMTGLGASVVRAGLMLIFVLIGKMIDRDAHSISLLSFVALLMLLYNPMYINDVGFQLSFIVTFGLLIVMPYVIKSENKIIDWIIGSVTVPVIAQFWVIPIQIFYFNNISVYSVFANIMSVPILAVISFGGFVSSLLAMIKPIAHFICMVFDFILNPLITILVNISDFWGNLPHASLQTTHPNPVQIILYYLILLNIISFIDKTLRSKKFLRYTLPVLIVLLLLSTVSIPDKNLEITTFDVGNADSFLIKTPDNKYIMIDTGKGGYNGGKSQAEMIIIKYLKDMGIKNLDSLIVTHFDNDHCGGAVDVINSMKVKKLYVNSVSHDSKQANEIYKTAKNKGTEIIAAENAQTVEQTEDLKITNYISNLSGVGDNENSIITIVKYNDFTMLFTGDAGIETLNNLLNYIPNNITVLKVGHHGAPGVINKKLADYLNPEYSIVSTGENKFGHPSVYTLETLNKTKILRTDISNSIKISANKKSYKVLTYDMKKRKFINVIE